MREPRGATPGARNPEPADAQSASDEMPAGDALFGSTAARMAQAIDQFIEQDQDCEHRAQADALAPVAPTRTDDIVARLAPRPLADSDRLPRIVTSSLPIRPPALPRDDAWRRQFLGALRDADDDAPMAPARKAPAEKRLDLPVHEHGGQRIAMTAGSPPVAETWRTARRVLAAAAAVTCVFSTGVIWATYRAEIVAGTVNPPAVLAAAIPERAVVAADTTPGQPIRNTPVLIREGEILPVASGIAPVGWSHMPPAVAPAISSAPMEPRSSNGSDTAQPIPVAPLAPVVRIVPVVAIEPVAPTPSASPVTSGESMAGAVSTPTSPPPPLDRDRLTALVTRPAEPLDPVPASKANAKPQRHDERTHRQPRHRESTIHRTPPRKVSSKSVQSRRTAPKVARGYVPEAAWEMRRQGLRTPPEPEPSTFKKLVSYVWPFGKSSTTAEPAKPAAPAVTAKPYSWSDTARARP